MGVVDVKIGQRYLRTENPTLSCFCFVSVSGQLVRFILTVVAGLTVQTMGFVSLIKDKLAVKPIKFYSKLHWYILAEDWNGCRRRIAKTNGAEARSMNEYGDLPLHFACYGGLAPPDIIRALLDAYPASVHVENSHGRVPLELATINYHIRTGTDEEAIDVSVRNEVLFLLRYHRPTNSLPPSMAIDDAPTLPGIFANKPPGQMFATAPMCVVCMDAPSCVAMIPCGHICLCTECGFSTAASSGKCPVDRCTIHGLYQLTSSISV